MADLEEFIKRQKERNPIATKILHKVWKALKEGGQPIISVYDGEETTPASTRQEVDMLVFNLDECYLNTPDGGWVRFVPENEWDSIVDYTLNLEDILKPVNDYVDKYNN